MDMLLFEEYNLINETKQFDKLYQKVFYSIKDVKDITHKKSDNKDSGVRYVIVNNTKYRIEKIKSFDKVVLVVLKGREIIKDDSIKGRVFKAYISQK